MYNMVYSVCMLIKYKIFNSEVMRIVKKRGIIGRESKKTLKCSVHMLYRNLQDELKPYNGFCGKNYTD